MESFDDIKLCKDKGEHLYVQLYKAIKGLIISGKISNDEKLPPIRKLAKELKVNNVTVVNAYHILEQEGLVYKKIGSGTYVSPDLFEYTYEEQGISNSSGSLSFIERGQIQIQKEKLSLMARYINVLIVVRN